MFEVWRVEEKWRPSAKLQKRRANIEKCRHLQWTRRPVHLGSLLRPWTVPATISFVKKQNHVLRHFVRNNETWRWLAKFQANFRWKCWTCLLLTVGILSQSVDGFLFEFRVLFAHYGRHWWRLAVAGGDRKTKDERRVFESGSNCAPAANQKVAHCWRLANQQIC